MYVTATAPAVQPVSAPDRLPPLRDLRILAITARPGQESAELGGLLTALRRSGCSIGLLCLTRGEAPLMERVERAIGEHEPDLLLVTDPVDGSPDDARLAQATCLAARRAGLPVAVRTLPGAVNSWLLDDRLDSLDGRVWLRWLVPPMTDSMSWLGSAWRPASVSISYPVPRPRNGSLWVYRDSDCDRANGWPWRHLP
jgi:LmbE family N-acetylglucosaminyl deacetylase